MTPAYTFTEMIAKIRHTRTGEELSELSDLFSAQLKRYQLFEAQLINEAIYSQMAAIVQRLQANN